MSYNIIFKDKKVGDYLDNYFLDDDRKGQLRFLVQIDKIDNPYQKENWEITTRNKTALPDNEDY